MSRDLIRWLHLSDFHVGKDDYGQCRLFDYILENLRSKVAAGEGPHLVFITGDIAHSGLATQYDLFEEEFLKPLRELVTADCQHIFIVPGNHDIDRTKSQAVRTHDVLDDVQRFLDPTEEGREHRKVIFERFETFAKWDAIGHDRHWLFSPKGSFEKVIDINGCSIGILGVNTAWLAYNDQDRHQLSAGKGIIEIGLKKLEECELRIILGHHPIDWFRDEDQEPVRSLFGRYHALYLHGHLHKSQARTEIGAGLPFQPIQSGAAFDARESEVWVNRFLWCALDLDGGRVIAEPLKWSRDWQRWITDTDAFLPDWKLPRQDLWAIVLPGRESPSPKRRIWNVPYNKNPNFTGREKVLNDLHDTLNLRKADVWNQPVAIYGLGGVGKTQIAIEFAYRHEADYWIIWWIRAEDSTRMTSDYAALASPLDLPLKDDANQSLIVSAVREWLGRHDGWLIVFDNAETYEDVRAFIPQTKSGHVILTSTNPNCIGIGAERFPVDVMCPEEAKNLLLRRSGQDDQTAAEKLAEELGFLPLALEQAAAYMETTATTISEYLDLYRQYGTRIFKHAPKNTDYPASVATTWEISFSKVGATSPEAADLLRFFAFLGPENIPRDLLPKGLGYFPKSIADVCSNRLQFKFVIGALRRYSLILVREESFSVHRLVQAVIRDRLSSDDRKKWANVAISVVTAAFPRHPEDPKKWPDCDELMSHAIAAAKYAELFGASAVVSSKLATLVVEYLRARAEYGPALAMVQRALRTNRRVFGPRHPIVATNLNQLGLVLSSLGRFREAKEILEQSIKIIQKIHGPESLEVARGLVNLGGVLFELGQLHQAKERFEQSLGILTMALDHHHPELARHLGNLGIVLGRLGRFQEAKEILEKANETLRKVLGPEHPEIAMGLINLSSVLIDLRQFDQAKEKSDQAVKILMKAFGLEHPLVAASLDSLGLVLTHLGQYQQGQEKHQEALEIRQKVFGPGHPEVARSLDNVGVALGRSGQWQQAREMAEKGLEIRQRILGPEHPDTADSLDHLGVAFGMLGQWRQAGENYQQGLEIRQKLFGPEHPEVANSLDHLGTALRKQGLWTESERKLKQALQILIAGLGEEHPDTQRVRANLELTKRKIL